MNQASGGSKKETSVRGMILALVVLILVAAGYLGLIAKNLGVSLPKLVGMMGAPLILLAVWGMIKGRGAWLWLLLPLLPLLPLP